MATEKTPNYSPAQEDFIRNFAGTGPDGRLNLADATAIAADPVMFVDGEPRKAKSIVAKIGRMGLPYAKKVPTRKDGSAVASKAKLVEEIATLAGVSFEALDKAARNDLVKLRDVLAA